MHTGRAYPLQAACGAPCLHPALHWGSTFCDGKQGRPSPGLPDNLKGWRETLELREQLAAVIIPF